MDKRGVGLRDLYPATLAVILIGIVLGIGIFVLNETSQAISTTTITVTNETLDFSGGSDTVDYASECGFHDMTILHMTANGSVVAATGNYSAATLSDSGVISNLSGGNFLDTQYNVTYTFLGTNNSASTGPCGSLTTTATGIGGLASWIAVIVVVLAAAVVLGIVINSFGRRGAV